jgi:hypothetical protein
VSDPPKGAPEAKQKNQEERPLSHPPGKLSTGLGYLFEAAPALPAALPVRFDLSAAVDAPINFGRHNRCLTAVLLVIGKRIPFH